MQAKVSEADVCLILEGSYPYVSGGVSSWTQDLIESQRDLTFHLVTLLPIEGNTVVRYQIPNNVASITNVFIPRLPKGSASVKHADTLFERLQAPLLRLQSSGGLAEVAEVMRILAPLRARLGSRLLLNSFAAWQMLLRMYHISQPGSSFLDYFWTWRGLLGGLYSVLLADLPRARLYHAASTGYAGLMAARAHLETGRPVLLTEHGIYTTERRIEIAMAPWLYGGQLPGLSIAKTHRNLKDLWVDTFVSYSHACYDACSKIITLHRDNQQLQVEDGAAPGKLAIIPNGIDYARYAAIRPDPEPRPPTIALIGRVVPIKDVKTFIWATGILREMIPGLRALILGPTDEDPDYVTECQTLVNYEGLQPTIDFAGRVRLEEYLGRIDAIVLTSISEAQPLVILEAGAAGVPTVATDVGCCREMILGSPHEHPPLGPGGAITPLSNPTATAQALAKLLADQELHQQCSNNIRQRVQRYYNKTDLDESYRALYETYRSAPGAAAWLRGQA